MSYNTQHNQPNSYKYEELPKSIEEVRQRTAQLLFDAYHSRVWTLIHAPPSSGKTYSTFQNVTDDTPPLAYAAARDDLRAQAKEHCETFGLTYLDLPSPQKACPTFKGEHGERRKNTVEIAYGRGVSGSDIHTIFELPCNGGCEYQQKWAKDFDKYDVLIAHYKQLYPDSVTDGRNVVVDEFAESGFVYSPQDTQQIVSNYVANHPEIPFESYTDLIANRNDDEKRRKTISWFESEVLKNEQLSDIGRILQSTGHVHTSAAKLVIGLLYADDLGNGFETTKRYVETGYKNYLRSDIYEDKTKGLLLGDSTVVHNRATGATELLTPPDLSNAHNVVALDGTPTLSMWTAAFDHSFEVDSVVPENEMNQYLKRIMNYRIVQIGSENSKYGGVKPYSSGKFVNENTDSSVFHEVEVRERRKPSLISTKKALEKYDECGALDKIANWMNYHEMLSSNDFENERIGVVSGSLNYGDDYIKKWCALDGKVAESNGEKGLDKSYGPHGDEILRHFRENQVLQAILRFGRNEDVINNGGTTVYLNTLSSPEWLTPNEIVEPTTFKNENTRVIVDVLRAEGPKTQSELADEVGIAQSTASKILIKLKKNKFISLGGTDDEGKVLYQWYENE